MNVSFLPQCFTYSLIIKDTKKSIESLLGIKIWGCTDRLLVIANLCK